LVLRQQSGIGGPYATSTAYQLVAEALASGGSLGVGFTPPANAWNGGVFADQLVVPTDGGGILSNLYYDTSNPNQTVLRYWQTGTGSGASVNNEGTWVWQIAPFGQAGAQVVSVNTLMSLNPAGALSLPFGTLSVARDPASALEVATMGWVGANTVASFNGRRGVVTLSAADVYGALCLDPCDPFITVSQANAAICGGINQAIASTPLVSSFNGRVGNVFLNTCDMNVATFTGPPSGLPPLMVPSPPDLTATPPPEPETVVNIAWLEAYVNTVLTGSTQGGPFATEAWVEEQLAAINVGVTSFNNRTGNVTLTLADITAAGGAPSASPAFTGVPSAPTAAVGTSTSQIATTAFVLENLAAISPGVVTFNTRSGAVTLEASDISGVGGALLASPNFTGTPTSSTPPTGDSSQRIATTAFVEAAIAAATAGVSTWNGRTGAVTMALSDITIAGGAPAASPAFSGVPTAPTAPNGTNTTQLATTAFVQNELTAISAGVISFNGRSGAVTFTANDLSAVNGATLASPAFTGTPTGPTAAPGTDSTQLATTAFVVNAIQGAAVTSFNGRSGAVTLSTADITGAGGAPSASPAFTGVPSAPTPAAGNNSTALATTAFVATALTSYLPLSGGTLTGPLNLAGNATQALNAVPLQQLQSYVATQLGGYLPLSGGTLTGVLSLPSGSSAAASLNFTGPGVGMWATTGTLWTSNNLTLGAGGGALLTCGNINATIGTVGALQMNTTGTTTNLNITTNNTMQAGNFQGGTGAFSGITVGGANCMPATNNGSSLGLAGQGWAAITVQNVNCTGQGLFPGVSLTGSNIVPATNNGSSCGITGQAWFQVVSYALTNVSDPRQKKDTSPYPAMGALAKVLAVPVINFRWLFEAETAPVHTGWDASQVAAQMPPPTVVVGTDPEQTLALNTNEMLAYLWAAVQELAAKAGIT